MPTSQVNRDKRGRTSIIIPAFLRDKFDMQSTDTVDIDTDGRNIIITPRIKHKIGE
jgi:bifunctional DNA-binding transcriptional regulator/antitoxin component of YhaV-PrlF toxin-antitoxin module